jgi:hypothetical protein
VPIIIFGLQVGTLTFADIIIQVGTFIIADIFSIQVGTFNNAYNPLIFIYFSR